MRDFFQGKLIEVRGIFERLAIHDLDKYMPMLANLYQRIQSASDSILKRMDSRYLKIGKSKGKTAFQETLQKLGDVNKRWKNLFLESRLKKRPLEVRVKHGRLFMQMNLLHSVYFLRTIPNMYGAQQVTETLYKILQENNLDMLHNDKLCFLNLMSSMEYPVMTFKEASKMSSELAKTKLMQSEAYLWYLLYQWPNNECLGEYYDEDKLVHCIRKLQEISNQNAWEINHVDSSRMGPKHRPLYFLSEGVEFNRFITDRNHQEKRKILTGCIVNDKKVELILPKGKKLSIRAAHLFMNKHLDAFSTVEFSLGFTLEGKI